MAETEGVQVVRVDSIRERTWCPQETGSREQKEKGVKAGVGCERDWVRFEEGFA